MKTQAAELKDTDFVFLKVKNLWTYFKSESLAFKSICAYLFIEYARPQEIFPVIDILPWAQFFLALSLFGLFTDNKAKFNFSGMHFIVLLFTLIIHLSIAGAYEPSWGMEFYILFMQWVVIYFLIASIITTKERFYIFFLVFFICSLKIAFGTARNFAFRGFGFTSWGLKGPSGYFENSGELAVLMLILFPISYFFYRTYKKDVRVWEKYLLMAAVICPILTILGSSSRGAQIALVVQLLVMFWRQIFKPKVLISIVVMVWLGWQVLPAEQKLRFTEIGEDKSSIQRTLYWENGWEMMKDHPVLGVGYFNFRPYFQDHYPEDVLYGYAQLPHNIFIQVGTDAGFLGLGIYILIIVLSLTRRLPVSLGSNREIGPYYLAAWQGLKIGIVGFVVAGQFVTIGYYPFLWISIALQTALKFAIQENFNRKA